MSYEAVLARVLVLLGCIEGFDTADLREARYDSKHVGNGHQKLV